MRERASELREWGLLPCSDRPREVENWEGRGPASAKVLSPSQDSELSLGHWRGSGRREGRGGMRDEVLLRNEQVGRVRGRGICGKT